MKIKAILALGLVMSVSSYAHAARPMQAVSRSPQVAVDGLLAADRAFSSASAKVELIDGLSAMFDAETVMPAPGGFVRGTEAIRAALRTNPLNAGAHATWTPVRGGISADSRHGFTIGFMTITAEGKPTRKAKYVAYWIKRANGWRVAAYKRAGQPDGAFSLDLMPASLPSKVLRPSSDPMKLAAYRASLDRAERGFSDDAQKIGIGPAFIKHGRPDATNVGGGAGFTVGNDKIGAAVGGGDSGPGVSWAPAKDGVIVAATGDFGITWGLIKPNGPAVAGQPPGFAYTTIWRREAPDKPWKYVAE